MADQPPPVDSTAPNPSAAPPPAPPAAAPATDPPAVATGAPATTGAAAADAPAAPTAPADVPAPAAATTNAAAPAAADDAALSPESIDALLKQANFDGPDSVEAGDASKGPSVDQLLQQVNSEDGAAGASGLPGADAEAFKLPSFQQVMADAQVSSIDLLRDVELNVKIELGRSRMLVEECPQTRRGERCGAG